MSNLNPVVYIVLSVYNWEKYFLEQLMSIFYQNYKNWYLIVVDDWSTDLSCYVFEKFVKDYDLNKKVKIIKQENQWTCKAVERWLLEIQKINKWDNLVALCDSDDIWTRDKLEIQVKYMQEHETCDLCFHDLVVVDENNNLKSESFIKKNLRVLNPNINSFFELAIQNHVTTTEIFFRTMYINSIIPIQNEWAKDYWIVLNFILSNKNIHFIDKSLWYYRVWHQSIQKALHNKWVLKSTERDFDLFVKLKEKYPKNKEIEYFINYFSYSIKWIKKWHPVLSFWLSCFYYPKRFFYVIKKWIEYRMKQKYITK